MWSHGKFFQVPLECLTMLGPSPLRDTGSTPKVLVSKSVSNFRYPSSRGDQWEFTPCSKKIKDASSFVFCLFY